MIIERIRQRQARRRQFHRDYAHDTTILVNLSWVLTRPMTVAQLAHRTSLPVTVINASLGRLLLRGWAVRQARTIPGTTPPVADWFEWHLTDAGRTEADRRAGW